MKPGVIVLLLLAIMLPVTAVCAYSITHGYSFKSIIKTNFGSFEFEGIPHQPKDADPLPPASGIK